ncbi:MAG: peptide deformylase [Oscillospiraceae bacterium]|nr:peptide deformylase [Oscillospiraceae bacterium]
MAIRNIVTKEDEILKKKCRPVEKFDERLWELLDDMAETMYQNDGVGLAAPQVGILRRVVVIDAGEGLIELVNPVIVSSSGRQEEYEGCLSCPGEYGLTKRPKKVTVKAQDRHGKTFTREGEDLLARAFCHELDHLEGILFLDIAEKIVEEKE